MTKTVKEVAEEYKKQTKEINKQEEAIDKLVDKIDETYRKTREAKVLDIEEEIEDAKKSLDELHDKILDVPASKQEDDLIDKYDAARQKVVELEEELQNLQEDTSIDKAAEQVERLDTELEAAKVNLEEMKERARELEEAFNEAVNKAAELERLEAIREEELARLEAMNKKLEDIKNTLKKAASVTFDGALSGAKKLAALSLAPFRKQLDSIKRSVGGLNKTFTSFIKRLQRGLVTVVMFQLMRQQIRNMLESLQNLLKANQQFSKSLNQIKVNLWTGFAPIWEAILPYINMLMQALVRLSGIFATFSASLFGKTTAQAKESAAALYEQANATKALGAAGKEAAGKLASFDQLEVNSANDAGGGGSTEIPIDWSTPVEDLQSELLEMIRRGEWYELGYELGQRLSSMLDRIPWDSIRSKASSIGKGIAELFNGSLDGTNWTNLGKTFAQGFNTMFDFGYNFVTTFDFKKFGKSIGDSVNGFVRNIEFSKAAQTFSDGIKGILDSVVEFVATVDWGDLGSKIVEFISNIDWGSIVAGLFYALGVALAGAITLLGTILWEGIIKPIGDFFGKHIEEAGGNVIKGLLNGIVQGVKNIGMWIWDNIVKPFIDGFKRLFGISSPSSVMAEFGGFLVQGLFNGIKALIDIVVAIWEWFKEKVVAIFTALTDWLSKVWEGIKQVWSVVATWFWEKVIQPIVNFFTNLWNKAVEIFNWIKDAIVSRFTAVRDTVSGIFSAIGGFFTGLWDKAKEIAEKIRDFWQGVFKKIGDFISDVFKGIVNAFIGVANTLLSGVEKIANAALIPLNAIIKGLNYIPGVNIPELKLTIPKIPMLAMGGIATAPTLAMIGEGREPEAVLPLSRLRELLGEIKSDGEMMLNLIIRIGDEDFARHAIKGIRLEEMRTGASILV